jgi:hypothetical protein
MANQFDDALSEWTLQLHCSLEQIDDLAGLPDRCTAKLPGSRRRKGLGPKSLGPLLQRLGLRWQLVTDPAALPLMKVRLAKKQLAHGGWPSNRRANFLLPCAYKTA